MSPKSRSGEAAAIDLLDAPLGSTGKLNWQTVANHYKAITEQRLTLLHLQEHNTSEAKSNKCIFPLSF